MKNDCLYHIYTERRKEVVLLWLRVLSNIGDRNNNMGITQVMSMSLFLFSSILHYEFNQLSVKSF